MTTDALAERRTFRTAAVFCQVLNLMSWLSIP
jgi:hypothetical protein